VNIHSVFLPNAPDEISDYVPSRILFITHIIAFNALLRVGKSWYTFQNRRKAKPLHSYCIPSFMAYSANNKHVLCDLYADVHIAIKHYNEHALIKISFLMRTIIKVYNLYIPMWKR
jgi:hypothetical protein